LLDAPSRPAFSARREFPARHNFPPPVFSVRARKNSARGGRAPLSILEIGFKLLSHFLPPPAMFPATVLKPVEPNEA
jgi:hypothetical protein